MRRSGRRGREGEGSCGGGSGGKGRGVSWELFGGSLRDQSDLSRVSSDRFDRLLSSKSGGWCSRRER